MEALAVIGWLVILCAGIYLAFVGAFFIWMWWAFRGDSPLAPAIAFCLGVATISLGCWLTPVEMSMKGAL